MNLQSTNGPAKAEREPVEFPHGLLTPSPRVLEAAARERARLPIEPAPEAQKRFLDEMILHEHFERWPGIEVAYRTVPEGVEVLAVGLAETLALRNQLTSEQRPTVKIRQI